MFLVTDKTNGSWRRVMKKCLVLILTVIIAVSFCACSDRKNQKMFENDQRIAQEKIEQVLDAVEKKDSASLTALFSKYGIDNAESFEKSVEELFNYFEGTIETYEDAVVPFVEGMEEKKQKQEMRLMQSTCEIKTTKHIYHLAIRFYAINTYNPEQIGIESLYIIKADEDKLLSESYGSNVEFVPGIHIGIPNE